MTAVYVLSETLQDTHRRSAEWNLEDLILIGKHHWSLQYMYQQFMCNMLGFFSNFFLILKSLSVITNFQKPYWDMPVGSC